MPKKGAEAKTGAKADEDEEGDDSAIIPHN